MWQDTSADRWVHYDTMDVPEEKTKSEIERLILETGRCLLYRAHPSAPVA